MIEDESGAMGFTCIELRSILKEIVREEGGGIGGEFEESFTNR